MPRFFSDDIREDELRIHGDDAFHIARALRMAVGDTITVADGKGTDYQATLTSIRDELCICRIQDRRTGQGEPAVPITLYMALPKGDKLETVVQKAVELGAYRIVPFVSSRCIKRPKEEKAQRQTERLCRIAKEAAGQCGRSRLPQVSEVYSFAKMLSEAAGADLPLFCYEGESTLQLKEALQGTTPTSVSVVVGSEGGFSPEEARAAAEAGLRCVSLGPRILRCETAPLFVLSALCCHLEM